MKANILFCLPLATIPAALKALARVCLLLLRGKLLDLWPDWRPAFRTGFWRTTAAGAAMALLLAGRLLCRLTGAGIVCVLPGGAGEPS